MEQYCEGEGTEIPRLNICSLGQLFNHPQNTLSRLTSHEVDIGSSFSLCTQVCCTQTFSRTFLPSSLPLPEILSLTFYLVSPTHLSKQAQTLLSPFPQLTITLYICHLMNAGILMYSNDFCVFPCCSLRIFKNKGYFFLISNICKHLVDWLPLVGLIC